MKNKDIYGCLNCFEIMEEVTIENDKPVCDHCGKKGTIISFLQTLYIIKDGMDNGTITLQDNEEDDFKDLIELLGEN